MSDKRYERKDGEGTLWVESNAEVLYKGSVLRDGKTHYLTILRSVNSDGKSKMEILKSMGLIYTNDNKLKETSPDISGPITFDEKPVKFAGWKKDIANGPPLLSIKLEDQEEPPF